MLTGAVPADPARAVSAAERETEDLALLTGPDAGGLLTAVLDAEGVDLDSWAVHQVHHRPGVGVTVGYTVGWRARPGQATGEEYLLATSAPLPTRAFLTRASSGSAGATPAGFPPDEDASDDGVPTPADGVAVVHVGGRTLHVWRHPADPALPALPRASDTTSVAALLGTDDVQLELVAYRPLRRAVLRASTTTDLAVHPTVQPTVHYLKVVRPHTATALHRRHELLLEAGVPAARTRLLADGLIVMDELSGTPLTDALAADGAAGLAPTAVVDLLDRLPASLLDMPRRPSWSENVERYVTAATAALPEQADRISALGRQVRELVDAGDVGPVVAGHGDLHDANLLLDVSTPGASAIVGLLDVDTAGPGHRVDDLACMLGHLSVLPVIAPDVHHRVPATVARWCADFETRVDPVALHARSAAVALSLIAGSHQQFPDADPAGWIDVVQAWVDGARERRTAPPAFLRDLSSSRPGPLIDGHQSEDISQKQSSNQQLAPHDQPGEKKP